MPRKSKPVCVMDTLGSAALKSEPPAEPELYQTVIVYLIQSRPDCTDDYREKRKEMVSEFKAIRLPLAGRFKNTEFFCAIHKRAVKDSRGGLFVVVADLYRRLHKLLTGPSPFQRSRIMYDVGGDAKVIRQKFTYLTTTLDDMDTKVKEAIYQPAELLTNCECCVACKLGKICADREEVLAIMVGCALSEWVSEVGVEHKMDRNLEQELVEVGTAHCITAGKGHSFSALTTSSYNIAVAFKLDPAPGSRLATLN